MKTESPTGSEDAISAYAGHHQQIEISESFQQNQTVAKDPSPPLVLIRCKRLPVVSDVSANMQKPFVRDIARMSKMELRTRYSKEANCHKAMLQRRRTHSAVVHPTFDSFASFLSYLGPMPGQRATIDRLDPSDPEYAPGKVRWADKLTQTRNRQNTVLINVPGCEPLTAKQLSSRQGVTPDTIRKRRKRGWTEAEILAGKQIKLSVLKSRPIAMAAPETPRERSNGHDPSRGWWHNMFAKFNPTNEEISTIEAYLQRKRYPISQKKIEFDQISKEFHEARQRGEHEPLPATHQMAMDIIHDGHYGGLSEKELRTSDRIYAEIWPKYKIHVLFENLEEGHLAILRRIDPQYIAEQEARMLEKLETKDRL